MEQIVRFSPKSAGGGTAVTNCPFPVGFGGFFQTDPNTIYSGTKWEQKKDVFILASGDTYAAGSTGGEAEHVLTEAEMPRHKHRGIDIDGVYVFGWDAGESLGYNFMNLNYCANRTSERLQTLYTGGSQPHNNMPPYFAMPFWIRTA